MQQERHVYCTLFDSGYLSRGLTLFSSLRGNGDNSDIYVLALDSYVEKYLQNQTNFSGIFVLTMEDLEREYPELLLVKDSRTRMEYVFTCTPLLIEYASNKAKLNNELCVYLDSDLYFFGDPQLAIREMENSSIGLTPHQYSRQLEAKLLKYGTFNAGWAAFRADSLGKSALEWYRTQTLNWCYDKPENGKYADQGYLDDISLMQGTKVLSKLGMNVAPWNTSTFEFTEHNENVLLDGGIPLNFFHFHGLRKTGRFFASSQLIYKSPMTELMRNSIYEPYVAKLSAMELLLQSEFSGPQAVRKRGHGLHGLLSRVWKKSMDIMSIISGNAIRRKIYSQ